MSGEWSAVGYTLAALGGLSKLRGLERCGAPWPAFSLRNQIPWLSSIVEPDIW